MSEYTPQEIWDFEKRVKRIVTAAVDEATSFGGDDAGEVLMTIAGRITEMAEEVSPSLFARS